MCLCTHRNILKRLPVSIVLWGFLDTPVFCWFLHPHDQNFHIPPFHAQFPNWTKRNIYVKNRKSVHFILRLRFPHIFTVFYVFERFLDIKSFFKLHLLSFPYCSYDLRKSQLAALKEKNGKLMLQVITQIC